MIPARENPFASHRTESLRYRFPGFCFENAIERLRELRWRGAILGPHGSGKTTLLLELYRRLKSDPSMPSERYCLWVVPREKNVRLAQWHQIFSSVRAETILLVDGIERLSCFHRWQLLGLLPERLPIIGPPTTIRSIVATTHRRVGLPIWITSQPNCLVMEELLLELHPSASPAMLCEAGKLFVEKQGNVREVFWNLYDRYSQQSTER